jgi:hypothetical protein
MRMMEEEELEAGREAGREEMVLKGLVAAGEVLPPYWSLSAANSWTCRSSETCPSRHYCAMMMNTDTTFYLTCKQQAREQALG